MPEGNTPTRKGRPSGLLINPAAVSHLLGLTPQVELARGARITAPVLSELMTGSRGASTAVADRLAAALQCDPGVIFPELVWFSTTIRHFSANGAWVSE